MSLDEIPVAVETPPRAWGRLYYEGGGDLKSGNTPTGVGKTSADTSGQSTRRKHPHGRGEDRCPW